MVPINQLFQLVIHLLTDWGQYYHVSCQMVLSYLFHLHQEHLNPNIIISKLKERVMLQSESFTNMFMVDISQYKLTINLCSGLLPKEKGIPPMASRRKHWWVVTLSNYCYTVNYHVRSENKNADFLSRSTTTQEIFLSENHVCRP